MTNQKPPRILITGSPGSGKSTLMATIIKDVGSRRIAGLRTPEVRRGGVRTGFEMIDLASGESEVLASTSEKGPIVAKYHVNVPGIDELVGKIEESLDEADLVFVDEIGKMELFSEKFKLFVENVFNLDKPVIAVVHRSIVARYLSKGQVFVVNRKNFEEVRKAILAELHLGG